MSKIVIDARLYGLENKGIGRYLINLIKELKNLRTEEQFVLLLKKKYYENLIIPRNWKKVRCDIDQYSVNEQTLLPKVIANLSPDLFHSPHTNFPVLYRGKYVLTVHDLIQLDYNPSSSNLFYPYYILKHISLKFVFEKAIRGAEKIIVPTKHVESLLLDRGISKKKIIQMYYGVDQSIVGVSSKRLLKKFGISEPYFVYVGALFPHKNVRTAVDAIEKVDANFVIVSSDDKFSDSLKEYVKEKALDRKVIFLSGLSDPDMGSLLNGSIAYVLPTFSEGFGLTGLEAITIGTILLSSNIPVLKEVYGHSATYFDPMSDESITEKMKKVLAFKKDIREKNIRESKKILKKYSWRKMAKETLSVYSNALMN